MCQSNAAHFTKNPLASFRSPWKRMKYFNQVHFVNVIVIPLQAWI